MRETNLNLGESNRRTLPMFIENGPADPRTHEAAIRIARRCRHVIQAVLREEEWMDADFEFYRIAREELESLRAKDGSGPGTSLGQPTGEGAVDGRRDA
jgi:hypothetical protein